VDEQSSLNDMPPPPPALPVLKPGTTATIIASPKNESAEAAPEMDENDVMRVSTSLITVPAEVMDRSGRYIGSLRKEDFRIYENGVEQARGATSRSEQSHQT
jgi:hypothetical protein